MRQGAIISGGAHLAMIVLAFWGLPELRDEVEERPTRVSTVSLVSAQDFEASQSSQPVAEMQDLAMPTPGEDGGAITPEAEAAIVNNTETVRPDAPEADASPDISGLIFVTPDVAVTVAEPEMADAGPIGFDMPLPDAAPQDGSVNSSNLAMSAPEVANLAPRIDTSAAPRRPDPVPDAREEVPEVAPETAPEPEPVEQEVAAAPQEATTEITPDAVEQERPTTPKAAARPRGRPERKVEEVEPEPEPTPAPEPEQTQSDAARQAEEAAIAAALEAATAPAETTGGARLGQDFNSGERQAIGDVIGGKWNKTLIEGKEGFERLVVTVRVKLTADGKVIGAVEPVDPAVPTGDFNVAFQAARRAVLRAQPIPLPSDKFRDGDFLEIRFDPGRAAVSLQ